MLSNTIQNQLLKQTLNTKITPEVLINIYKLLHRYKQKSWFDVKLGQTYRRTQGVNFTTVIKQNQNETVSAPTQNNRVTSV